MSAPEQPESVEPGDPGQEGKKETRGGEGAPSAPDAGTYRTPPDAGNIAASAAVQPGQPDAAPDTAAPRNGADAKGEAQPAIPAAQKPESFQPSRPEVFRLAGEQPVVVRLSRNALMAGGLVICFVVGGMLIWALRSSHHEAGPNLIDTTHTAKSDIVSAAPGSYDKVQKLGPALPGDVGSAILAAQRNGQVSLGQTAPSSSPAQNPRLVAAEQARQRVQQERVSALGSGLFLGGGSAAQPASVATGAAGAAAVPAPSTGSSLASGAADKESPTSGQTTKRAFLQVSANRTTASTAKVAEVTSPYVLQAGSVIPAALITGIRSDLPGQLTAQVTQNVYDSPTGRILLIPQGARLIGEYDSQVSAGQNRVLLAWDRLILPGGRSILLERQPGADVAGNAGLHDGTNYHWGSLLQAAAISTLLGVGTEMATNSNDQLVEAFRYGTQDTINQTGKQLVQRELSVAPTLTIRPGFPLRVIITRDLVLEPRGGQ